MCSMSAGSQLLSPGQGPLSWAPSPTAP